MKIDAINLIDVLQFDFEQKNEIENELTTENWNELSRWVSQIQTENVFRNVLERKVINFHEFICETYKI